MRNAERSTHPHLRQRGGQLVWAAEFVDPERHLRQHDDQLRVADLLYGRRGLHAVRRNHRGRGGHGLRPRQCCRATRQGRASVAVVRHRHPVRDRDLSGCSRAHNLWRAGGHVGGHFDFPARIHHGRGFELHDNGRNRPRRSHRALERGAQCDKARPHRQPHRLHEQQLDDARERAYVEQLLPLAPVRDLAEVYAVAQHLVDVLLVDARAGAHAPVLCRPGLGRDALGGQPGGDLRG